MKGAASPSGPAGALVSVVADSVSRTGGPAGGGDRGLGREAGKLAAHGVAAQQRGHAGQQLGGHEGLGEVVVDAHREGGQAVGLVGAGREHEHGQAGAGRVGLEAGQQLGAAQAGHHGVGGDEVDGGFAGQHVQRVLAVGGGEHLVGRGQQLAQVLAQVGLVFHHQHAGL